MTVNSVEKWLMRREQWAVAYWLASQFANGGEEVNRSNILRAMAWFEAIPDYVVDNVVDEKKIKSFAKDCTGLASFEALGVTTLRLKQVLNELSRLPSMIDLSDAYETS